MKSPYTFSVLRYIHDPVTQEFINVGVAVYSQKAGFLKSMCTPHYARLTHTFARIDGNRFRQLTRYIQNEINAIGEGLSGELPFESGRTIEQLLNRVLPQDDSSLQFSNPTGAGLSADLDKTLADIFDRYVERYVVHSEASRRNDEDVWRVFREPLEQRHLTPHLAPKRIVASNYDYEFGRAWKNHIWHLYEPVSFDMADAGAILDKANRWVGRAISLKDSSEKFRIHMLLGEPQDDCLREAFEKAQNILRKMPGSTEFVKESEADAFADKLEKAIGDHEG